MLDTKAIRLLVFDFDGVFTDNSVYVFEDAREAVRCSRLDGMGVTLLRKKEGIEMMILSTEANKVVTARANKLKLPCIQNSADKGKALEEVVAQKGLAFDQVAYVGNDINDLECLTLAGLPITVADAHPSVRSLGRYITRATGGNGAVREICDLFLADRNG